MKYRRCLVIADGFYEWKRPAGGHGPKQAYHVTVGRGELFAMAGLWETWHDPSGSGSELDTCTVLTTGANALMAPIHDRMPVIVPPQAYDQWLDPSMQDAATVSPLLVPYPSEAMAATAVSSYVSRPQNEGPACLQPVPVQGELF
jgi:putative SOS response-associated peptidase YedK